jgi:hypothetical protein
MSPAEKRKTTRRTISYPALIDIGDGSLPRECSFCDASQEGAQLLVADADSLPDQFILILSAGGAARRNCHVVWRREKQIGVEFVRDTRKSAQTPALPRFNFLEPADSNFGESTNEADGQPADLATLPPR